MAPSTAIVEATAGLPCDETGFEQANSGVLATTPDKCGGQDQTTPKAFPKDFDNERTASTAAVSPTTHNICSSDNEIMSMPSDKNCDNRRSTSAAVVSPITNVKRCGTKKHENHRPSSTAAVLGVNSSEPMSAAFDDNEIKPISVNSSEPMSAASDNKEVKPISVNSSELMPAASDNNEIKAISMNSSGQIPTAVGNNETKPISSGPIPSAFDDYKTKPISVNSLGPMPAAVDDNDINPISLDGFDNGIENHSDRGIGVELMKQLSFDCDYDVQNNATDVDTEDIPTKGCIDSRKKTDDGCNEQDWAKKIVVITDSSGNLIEDLECDESSTSSMTTIIGSDQSSSAHVDEDLEDTFRPDETIMDEGEIDDTDDDCDSVDPLHSSCFVIFGDDYDGRKTSNRSNGEETADFKVPRPNTSRINPMSGKRSLTDDMQEWKNNVLSSWTLTPPKERKKNIKRKTKHKHTVGQHVYSLRGKTNKTTDFATAAVANVDSILKSSTKNLLRKKCRELQNIASYNRPGGSKRSRERSADSTIQTQDDVEKDISIDKGVSSHNSSTKCRPESEKSARIIARVGNYRLGTGRKKTAIAPSFPKPKQFTIKVKIGDAIFVPAFEKKYGLQVSSHFIKSHESSNGASALRKIPDCNKITSPLTSSGTIGNIPTTIGRNGNVQLCLKESTKAEESPRDQVFPSKKRKEEETSRELQTTAAASRPIMNKVDAKEKPFVAQQKQMKNICRQREPESKKPSLKTSKKRSDEPLNVDKVSIGSSRIAKRFIFNPLRRKGRDKTKIFFGTVASKQIDKDVDGTCTDLWHIIYDDGDEEYFDAPELKSALELYKHTKRWDKKHREKMQSLSGTNKEKSKDSCFSETGKKWKLRQEVHLRSAEPSQSTLLQKKPVAVCNIQELRGRSKKKRVRFPPARSEETDSKQGQLEMSGARQSRCLQRSTHSVDLETRVSDDDSIEVIDVVDLTEDSNNVGNIIDIVDLTISL